VMDFTRNNTRDQTLLYMTLNIRLKSILTSVGIENEKK